MSSSGRSGWFQSLGEPVPDYRIEAAREQAEQMGLDDIDMDIWLRDIVKHVERDRPAKAIDQARDRLDLTGAYRLLAYLCVAPDPADREPHPNEWLVSDLYTTGNGRDGGRS